MKVAQKPWLIWCALNPEQEALERAFGDRAFSVYGSLPPEEKVARVQAWLSGERPILISKVSIIGFGMNFQNCADVVFCGLNDSFEQVYQAIRRCWRFGQTRPVSVYMIASELEGAVVANIEAKERAFDAMGAAMAEHMKDLVKRNVRAGRVQQSTYEARKEMQLPGWLSGGAA